MWRIWGGKEQPGEGGADAAEAGKDGAHEAAAAEEEAALIELKKLIWDLLTDAEDSDAGKEKPKEQVEDSAKQKPDDAGDESKNKKDGESKTPGEKAGATDPSLGSWMGSSRHDGPALESPPEETMRRFLRGHKQDPKIAAERIRKYVEWRASQSYGLEHPVREISEDTPGVRDQILTGKCYILNKKDKLGRPIIVVHVRRHDPSTQSRDELTRFGVFILETAEQRLDVPPASIESDKFCIIFDLEAISISNIDYHAAKRIIYMLTYFYPERMGVTLLLSAPMIFSAAWPVIRPWLHPNSQRKIQFVKPADLSKWIDPPALPKIWGGEDATEYVKTDLKTNSKTDAKTDAKTEVQTDAKSDMKTEAPAS